MDSSKTANTRIDANLTTVGEDTAAGIQGVSLTAKRMFFSLTALRLKHDLANDKAANSLALLERISDYSPTSGDRMRR